MKSKKLLSLVSVSMVCAMLFSGCAYIPKNFKLIDINNGEDTITLGYGNFAARYMQAMYDQVYSGYYGTSMWGQDLYNSGNTFEEDVKSDVIDTIEEMYLLSMHASEYGVELSADDEAAIKKAAAEFMKNNSKDAIKQVGATEEYVADFIRYQQVATMVEEAIKAEAPEDPVEDIEDAETDENEETTEASAEDTEDVTESAADKYYDEIIKGWKDETSFDVNEKYWSWVTFSEYFTYQETTEE